VWWTDIRRRVIAKKVGEAWVKTGFDETADLMLV